MATVGEALAAAAARIDRRDAQVLAAHAWGVDRAWLVAHDRDTLRGDQFRDLQRLIDERARGVPVAYLTATREFFGRRFAVSPAVLIPRPETEILVEAAMARLPSNGRLLDLGTGSGAIAITVACERPDADVTATDLSPDALDLARANARALGVRIRTRQGNWFDAIGDETFDVIVANPPYIAKDDAHLFQGDLRFEPKVALTDGSPDGLASLRTLIGGAKRHLRPGGWLLVEHGHDQADACAGLFAEGHFTGIARLRDLAGISRVVGGCRNAP